MSDKDAQDMCKPGREEGPAVDHVSRCITYRDALLGTLAPKHKDRVPETDITVKIEVTEHDAALHAHPHSLAHVMARDLAAEMTFKQHENSSIEEISKVKDHTSYREWEAVTTTDPTISSTQDEERSSTGSPTSVSSTQSSLSNHPIRKIKIPVREKLSPIKEVSSEATRIFYGDESPSQQAEKDSTSDESQSYLVCTPRSSKTTSTGWTSAGPLDTPQMKPFETGPTEKTTASFHAISSHAHPSSSAQGDKTTQNTTTPSEFVSIQKPDSFFWQLDSHGFQCAKAECEKCCNLWDGESVICPRCGPFSEVRYCCKEHLLDDIKWHWLYCEQMTFEHPCRESSIPLDVRNGPPFVPCLHAYDTPERHRQAVYFAANHNMGDYFIFSDWIDMMEAGFPENNPELRCSNRVIYRIAFNDANEKDRFRRVLATCLFMTIEVVELVDYLFRLIRDKLRSENAPPELETALKWQFFEEFAVMIQQQISGERHACTTDWDGRNRRICRDAVCRGEYRRLLGTLGGKGHRQLIGHLEGSYWILRAARTTHPTVHDPRARMRGEGFEDVAEEDRREFRRGAGWDGAGTGEMEIEGIND
ncbi:hypothetical protein BDV25DRAFT_141459 [Aspergillus avenaceus]|uniref:Uncharacterized protein n=1 Tax=Aspergillus avenaceus TaxID=36643 RepID=A0A5N6TRJ3_ASPAV|nr:hypothetical protein BDV25DRAFT_141459 [Aspergillus avenaceus]